VYGAAEVRAFEWLCACVASVIRRDHDTDRSLRELTGDGPVGVAPTLPEVINDLSNKLEVIRAAIVDIRGAVQAGDDVLDRLSDLEQLCTRTQHEIFAVLILPSMDVVEPLTTLTKREREVAELVADGVANEEIAERLTIAASTLKTHITHIHKKLQVTNRVELAAKLRPFQ
jgi:DNA-binding CsgD family transcriptional regulator